MRGLVRTIQARLALSRPRAGCGGPLLESQRPLAWLLPSKRLPVTHPGATDVRFERLQSGVRRLGYETVVRQPPRLRSAPWIVYRALRERPALIVTSPAVSAPAIAWIRRLRGRRTLLVADVMGLPSLEIDQASRAWARPLLRRTWTALERRLFRSVDLVLAVDDRHAALVRRRYRPGGVHTLRDAAEAELVAIPPADRGALRIPEDAVAVALIGPLVNSGLEPIFQAWEELAEDSRLWLIVVGDGPDLVRYRERAQKAGWLAHNVVFLGGLPRVEALAAVQASDIAYSHCWAEAGFPARLFDYMALGMPIVTEGKPQISEVLEEGESALFFASPQELVLHIRRLADDRALRERLGAAAREALLSAHTVEQREQEFAETIALAALADDRQRTPRRPPVTRSAPELVSVVMPIRNGEDHIEEQLAAIAGQTYAGAWELVVVDNGCSDASIEIVERWRERLPCLRVVDGSARRGANYARNRGVAQARGEFLAFCDADDLAAPDWLERLVAVAPNADIVAGMKDSETLNAPEHRAWRPGRLRGHLPLQYCFLPAVAGGNTGVWAEVARELEWDESFRRCADVDFGWRAQLAGYTIAPAAQAEMMIRYRTTLRSLMLQWYGLGRSHPQLFRRFQPSGMRRGGLRETLGNWSRLVWRSPDLLRSSELRGDWLRRAALLSGRVIGSIRWRALYLTPPPPLPTGQSSKP